MDRNDEARRYFGHPGFARFLAELERKHRASNNGARGYIAIKQLRDDEREKLNEYYGIYRPPVKDEAMLYSVKLFSQVLLEGRFQLTVPELLTLLRGEPVLTRMEQSMQAKAGWRGIITSAMEQVRLDASSEDKAIRRWAEEVLEETATGVRTLRMVFNASPEEAERCMVHCLRALTRVARNESNKLIRLPVLAAQITGDAHALDWKFPLGRLFWWGLNATAGHIPGDWEEAAAEQQEAEVAGTQAMLIREGYRRGGIADDDLSSQVLLFAPELLGAWEERVLTLRQVEAIRLETLGRLSARRILMVENPSVFAELIDACLARARLSAGQAAPGPVIVCGNGQPTTAVICLLDMLLGKPGERELRYAGDIDPPGLGIAHSLQMRYKQSFRLWRMDREVFSRYAHQGLPMDEKEKAKLRSCRAVWDEQLADAMLAYNVKLHQELWLDELLQDASVWLDF